MKKTTLSLLLFSSLYADTFSTNTTFQGYTGLINTPNAQVTREGNSILHLNNQFDNNIIGYNYNTQHHSQEDYIVGFGLLSFMEVQGRLSEATRSKNSFNDGGNFHRDLSANFKLQLPYHHKYLPDLAVGIQDLGGAANIYDNQYLVLDKQLSFLRASIGYGHSNSEYKNKERMNGLFYGLEIKVTDWLYFMGEDDTKEKQIALRLELPQPWKNSFNIQTTITKNITSDEINLGVTLTIPLKHKSARTSHITTQIEELKTSKYDDTFSFEKKLIDFGFENVKVVTMKDTLHIEVENSIFDHTDLDAIGYILGTLSFSNLDITKYTLTLLKNNLQTITIIGTVKNFKNYVKNPSLLNRKKLIASLSFSRDFNTKDIPYNEKKNSSFFIPRVELSLGLTTTVGTEVGVLDYITALRVNSYINIYDGLTLSTMYEMPFAHSDDFGKGGVFYYSTKEKLENRVINTMLHQTFHIKNILNTISIGKYQVDYFGIINQTNITTDSGIHALQWRGGSFENRERSFEKKKTFALTTYRYVYSPLDIYLSATYGKFWYGDRGYQLEFKRFFGETDVSFHLKNTSIHNIKEEFAGIKVSFPITTRKLYKANYIQIKGKKDFYYKLQTTINKEDGSNTLNYNYGIVPKTDFELTTNYLDRDRLNSSYIKKHIDRVREAYILYQ